MDDKHRRALQVDMDALNSNLVPEWLLLRTLDSLGIIKRETFYPALRAQVDRMVAENPDIKDQLERVVDLFNFEPFDDTPKPPTKPPPR